MRDKLRQRYQIHKEVSRSSYFQSQLNVADLPRLCELLATDQGEIAINFEFQKSEYDSIALLTGQIEAQLQVECQRCLEPMDTSLQFDFKLLVDANDEIVRESRLDTVYSEDGFINIFEVIEDEVILSLPLVPMHQHETCNEYWLAADENLEPAIKENPFSVLKSLKTNH